MFWKVPKLSRWPVSVVAQLLTLLFVIGNVHGSQTYSPNHVFAGVEYANHVVDRLLLSRNIKDIQLPHSLERAAKPMHVYELHVSVIAELYYYALKNNRRPPPLPSSTPIKYTPTDVFYLTQLVMSNVESIYLDSGGVVDFELANHRGKSPTNVYQELFELYYKLNRLNGKRKVSPSEVYSHIYRAKEDLKYSLLVLSNRLPDTQETKKRLLVTAIYGMHPDGTVMPAMKQGKKPGDVIEKAFDVRKKLNALRKRNNLPEITIPRVSGYGKIKPIDVFLQTQFIIAELNLLKIPMKISSTTNSPKPITGKTPSDVYQEMAHIAYMLERIIHVL